MDLQMTLDFFEVVTYITEYYSKDDSGVVEYLKRAKKELLDSNIQKQFRQMANAFLSHRRLGEHLLPPGLHHAADLRAAGGGPQ